MPGTREDSFCDQSSYENIRECRSALNDLFEAMALELDDRKAHEGEHALVNSLEIVVNELCHAQMIVEHNKVEALVWPHPAPKTDELLVAECNELARRFYLSCGYHVPKGYRFDQSEHPQEALCWCQAAEAFSFIEGADIEEPAMQVGDEPVVP